MATSDPVRQCPWCQRLCLKTVRSCNHVVCGVDDSGKFQVGCGCGRQFCFQCEGKLCGLVYREDGTGTGASQSHNAGQHNPTTEEPCDGEGWCPGKHNSHKD